jgi:hypothetical protein
MKFITTFFLFFYGLTFSAFTQEGHEARSPKITDKKSYRAKNASIQDVADIMSRIFTSATLGHIYLDDQKSTATNLMAYQKIQTNYLLLGTGGAFFPLSDDSSSKINMAFLDFDLNMAFSLNENNFFLSDARLHLFKLNANLSNFGQIHSKYVGFKYRDMMNVNGLKSYDLNFLDLDYMFPVDLLDGGSLQLIFDVKTLLSISAHESLRQQGNQFSDFNDQKDYPNFVFFINPRLGLAILFQSDILSQVDFGGSIGLESRSDGLSKINYTHFFTQADLKFYFGSEKNINLKLQFQKSDFDWRNYKLVQLESSHETRLSTQLEFLF